MDSSHRNHFYPEDRSSPQITSEIMDSASEHILDQPIGGEQTDLRSTSSVPGQRWLPLRPRRSCDDTQNLQSEALQSDATYSELANSESIQPEAKEQESESSEAQKSTLAAPCAVEPAPGPPPDTLVFIDYPNTARFSEFSGLSIPLRVHSAKLLGTGSRVFRELLSPTKNFRAIRRRKLVNRLPENIKYVIDLTPPDEGDEAVDLTADLSLSLGIRQWYTMWRTGKIINVGGSDESADSDLVPLLALELTRQSDRFRGSSSPPNSNSSQKRLPLYHDDQPLTCSEEDSDLQRADVMSQTSDDYGYVDPPSEEREIPEYSNVRHRLGIQRLLQVIEGRDPDLDSAPKVWTLWVLAKHFDCTISVVDDISKWLIAEPNSLFIEILPEMSAKMGLGLQSHAVTRAAFSVLVGEEALAVICNRRSQSDPESPTTTRFGRRKEDIDEDLRNKIQYASKAFEERISATFEYFFHQDLEWLSQLPEYKKIAQFQHAIDESQDERGSQWACCLQLLHHLIKSFIRRRILLALNSPLTRTELAKYFTERRNLENLGSPRSWAHDEPLSMYDRLSMPERVFTRPFWARLRSFGFTLDGTFSGGHYYLNEEGRGFAKQDKIDLVTYSDLTTATINLNKAVIEAISAGCLNGGQIPPEAIPDIAKKVDTEDNYPTLGSGWRNFQFPTPLHGSWNLDPWRKPLAGKSEQGEPKSQTEAHSSSISVSSTAAIIDGHTQHTRPLKTVPPSSPPISKMDLEVPSSSLIDENSPFLNLRRLLNQADNYIISLCDTMLSTKTMGFDVATTDVLLCLTDNEFKYLPVFAGGLDDGTGLVFTDPVPEATNGLAPIGPGPSFRTGVSVTEGSTDERSEFSYGGDTETSSDIDGGSKIVEDGFSGVFPRMRMVSGSDVASVAWSDAESSSTQVESGKGKGVVKGKFREIATTFTPGTSVIDDNGNESVSGGTYTTEVKFAIGKGKGVIKGVGGKFRELATVFNPRTSVIDDNGNDSVSGDTDTNVEMSDDMRDSFDIAAELSTAMDDDDNLDNFDFGNGYGYEEADMDGEEDEEEDDDNDTTIGDIGDIGDVHNDDAMDDINENPASAAKLVGGMAEMAGKAQGLGVTKENDSEEVMMKDGEVMKEDEEMIKTDVHRDEDEDMLKSDEDVLRFDDDNLIAL